MKKLPLITILFLSSCKFLFAQAINSKLIAINLNSCSSCNRALNQVLKSLNDKDITLLFSEKNATLEDAKEFTETNEIKQIPIIFNENLYQKITEKSQNFKQPQFVIINESERILFKCPIDSIHYYKDKIRGYQQNNWEKSIINQPRIKKMWGSSTINQIGDFLFLTSWGNSEKTYIYNTKLGSLDSIDFTNKINILESALKLKTIKGIDIKAQIKFFKQNKLPYQFVSFGKNPLVGDSLLYNVMYIEYLKDLINPGDTISPELLFYFLTYNPYTKILNIYDYKYYEKDSIEGEVANGLRLDYLYYKKVNDSTWLLGAEPINEFKEQKKYFFCFNNSQSNKQLKFNGMVEEIKTDSLIDFQGEPMNNPINVYSYILQENFLFYRQSPYFYDTKNKKTINLLNYSNSISWVLDVQISSNIIELLIEDNDQICLLTLDRFTFTQIKKETISNAVNKGNAIYQNNVITFLDKNNSIIRFSRSK